MSQTFKYDQVLKESYNWRDCFEVLNTWAKFEIAKKYAHNK